MVRKLYDMVIGIPPGFRLTILTVFGIIGLMLGKTLAPAIYLAACAVILINMRKK